MRLTFITQRLVYPPDAGTPIRNYNLIAQAARRHRVTVFGYTQPDAYPHPLAAAGVELHLLPEPSVSRFSRLRQLALQRRPDMATRSVSSELLATLERGLAASAPNVVQVQALDMAYVVETVRRLVPQARVILDEHNAEFALRRAMSPLRRPVDWPRALLTRYDAAALRRYERNVASRFDALVTVSEADRELLQSIGVTVPMVVVPNGVDLEQYRRVTPAPELAVGGPHIVYTGTMAYRPNADAAQWFVAHCLPPIVAKWPEARFWVVGREPPPSVQALARDPAVRVTGAVPDARLYIAGATIVVSPLLSGGGTKLKVLEAAALSRPQVLTSVAAAGFPISPGDEALIADGPREFTDACLHLLARPELAESMGRQGLEGLARPHDWSLLYPRLEELYERTVAS